MAKSLSILCVHPVGCTFDAGGVHPRSVVPIANR